MYDQAELIDMLIERLEFSFSEDYDHSNNQHYEYVAEIESI